MFLTGKENEGLIWGSGYSPKRVGQVVAEQVAPKGSQLVFCKGEDPDFPDVIEIRSGDQGDRKDATVARMGGSSSKSNILKVQIERGDPELIAAAEKALKDMREAPRASKIRAIFASIGF